MVISFAHQKGGTGKTTSLLSLADYLSSMGKSVLVIDLDPQASSTSFLLHFDENTENTLTSDQIAHKILTDGVDLEPTKLGESNIFLIPSSGLLSQTELNLALDNSENSRVHRLKNWLDTRKNDYDFVFIDCAGSLGILTMNGLVASDQVLVVSSIGKFERLSTKYFMKAINETVKAFNPSIQVLGILLTMTDPYNITDKTIASLKQDSEIESKLFTSNIPKNNAIRNATNDSISIWKYDPYSPSAKAYIRVWEEIEQRLS